MYCRDCGEKLSLRFLENEGLVPYCTKCDKFKFPFFPVAVAMTVVNRDENKILLARHVGETDYKLCAGYVKKGENDSARIKRRDQPYSREMAVCRFALSRRTERTDAELSCDRK